MTLRAGIVFTSYYADLGGGELRMLEHLALTGLPRERLSVALFEGGPFRRRIEALGIQTEEIPWSLARPRPRKWVETARAALRLARHLRRRRAGTVFCNTYNDLLLAGRVARALGLPVLWRSHADLFPSFARLPHTRRQAIVKMLDRIVTRALATTDYDRQLMVAAGVPAERIHVVPLGVDLAAYAAAAPDGRGLRDELRIAPAAPVIGFVARMVPQKGHLVFFDALAQVARHHPQVRVLVVGDAAADGSDPDGFRRALKARVDELGLSPVVTFTGFRDDIPAVMNAIDLFVHASLKEPFGSVLVEAMAAARPVIASKTLGPQEIIEDGVTGLLTPPGDARALATAILRLLDDPGLARGLAERGHARAVAKYDLRDTIALLDRHFREVLDGRATSSTPWGAGAAVCR